MLGIPDPWVLSAYLLTFLSGLFCAIYGVIYWNKGGEEEEEQIKEELEWEKKDEEFEKEEMGL
jgi:hypothetical protein